MCATGSHSLEWDFCKLSENLVQPGDVRKRFVGGAWAGQSTKRIPNRGIYKAFLSCRKNIPIIFHDRFHIMQITSNRMSTRTPLRFPLCEEYDFNTVCCLLLFFVQSYMKNKAYINTELVMPRFLPRSRRDFTFMAMCFRRL